MTRPQSPDLPHHITSVVAELNNANTSLNIPQHTGHVTRGRDNLAVVEETAATQITRVGAELAGALDVVALLGMEIVDRADVVEATTRHVASGGGVCARHDPAGTKGNGMDLVGGVGVPDDKLSVLRRRDEVPPVGSPVHGIDLGKVTAESPTWPHDYTRQLVDLVSGHCLHCKVRILR